QLVRVIAGDRHAAVVPPWRPRPTPQAERSIEPDADLDRVVCVQGRVERRPDVERTTEADEELTRPAVWRMEHFPGVSRTRRAGSRVVSARDSLTCRRSRAGSRAVRPATSTKQKVAFRQASPAALDLFHQPDLLGCEVEQMTEEEHELPILLVAPAPARH